MFPGATLKSCNSMKVNAKLLINLIILISCISCRRYDRGKKLIHRGSLPQTERVLPK